MLQRSIEPKLLPQNSQDEFMSQRAIVRPQAIVVLREQGRGVGAFGFDAAQDFKCSASCRRDLHR
jgi:hypothetical protein